MDILLRERQDLLVVLGMLLLPQHRQQLFSRIEARNQMLTGNDFGWSLIFLILGEESDVYVRLAASGIPKLYCQLLI